MPQEVSACFFERISLAGKAAEQETYVLIIRISNMLLLRVLCQYYRALTHVKSICDTFQCLRAHLGERVPSSIEREWRRACSLFKSLCGRDMVRRKVVTSVLTLFKPQLRRHLLQYFYTGEGNMSNEMHNKVYVKAEECTVLDSLKAKLQRLQLTLACLQPVFKHF